MVWPQFRPNKETEALRVLWKFMLKSVSRFQLTFKLISLVTKWFILVSTLESFSSGPGTDTGTFHISHTWLQYHRKYVILISFKPDFNIIANVMLIFCSETSTIWASWTFRACFVNINMQNMSLCVWGQTQVGFKFTLWVWCPSSYMGKNVMFLTRLLSDSGVDYIH